MKSIRKLHSPAVATSRPLMHGLLALAESSKTPSGRAAKSPSCERKISRLGFSFSPRSSASPDIYRSAGKRVLDLLLVWISFPIFLPIMIILALLVAADGHSPFYFQQRVGRGGRIFTMWKLRTMVPGAHMMLEAYLATNDDARDEWQRTQKLRNDPRITPLGRFLRKSSLDELPQLLNVLSGEMSLVGPRPMMPCQQSLYPGTCYIELRPGITGLWQVSERNQSTFAERAKFDSTYNRTLSLRTDFSIILATFSVVLRGTGC
jgi:exopolysaccharide production protein ExoY